MHAIVNWRNGGETAYDDVPEQDGGTLETGGIYTHGFKGCIHKFGIQNHCSEDADPHCLQFGQDQVDFSDESIILQYIGSESTEKCSLGDFSSSQPHVKKSFS